MRMVSLVPNATGSVFALGAGELPVDGRPRQVDGIERLAGTFRR